MKTSYMGSIRLRAALALAAAAAVLAGCSGDDNQTLIDDAAREKEATLEVKEMIQVSLDDLHAEAVALCDAAPAPDMDGWNAAMDAAAVGEMREHWKAARRAYESTEGAIAVIYPELDEATDARYDAFIEVTPDDDLFDDVGVVGAHAIERILWADMIPTAVVTFEAGLSGYKPAAFPATQAEATAFKEKLCARFVADVQKMKDDFAPLALDASAAYRGVIGSLEEQIEKINLAATGEEESRYAQFTLGDMRANVAASRATYEAFQEWLIAKGGASVDAEILAGFKRVEDAYAALPGDSLPPVPEGWSSDAPSAAHLDTPFGRLFALLREESDATKQGSLVSGMLRSADILGIEPLL